MYIAQPIYTYEQITEIMQTYMSDMLYFEQQFVVRRTHALCNQLYIPSLHALREKFVDIPSFADSFLQHFIVAETEMFRDVQVWNTLYTLLTTEHIPDDFKIWLPNVSTGEELFSICIILQILQLQNRVEIFASHRSMAAIETIKKGVFCEHHETRSTQNFSKLALPFSLQEFYTKSFKSLYMNASLLKNVHFIHSHSILQQLDTNFDLILFRNHLLYYSEQLHDIIVANITKHIKKNGLLLLGMQDNNAVPTLKNAYKLLSLDERIYRKK